MLDIDSFGTIEHDRQMRAFGRDLIVVPLPPALGIGDTLATLGTARCRTPGLGVDRRYSPRSALGADGFWIGDAKKDAAVRGVVGPELGPDLEVLVGVLRDQMAALAFVGHDRAVLGPPIGIADPVPVVQGLGVRAVKGK